MSRKTAATAKRAAKGSQSPRRFPARYSKDYPVNEGHSYVLNAIPFDIWERAKMRAHGEERAVRTILIKALDLYGSGRLNL